MFSEIGVHVQLRNGIPARPVGDACAAPIVIQIENGAGYRGGGNALAYASPFRNSGTCIHVFVDRMLLYDRGQAFSNALLAHVIVHEVTHVLQKIDRHSTVGVMKAVWSERDYDHMRRGTLSFAPEDVDLIRQGVLRRTIANVLE